MADKPQAEIPKVDATPALGEKKADSPAETGQAKTNGEASVGTTTDPAAAPTVAPVSAKSESAETKIAEEKEDAYKAENADSTSKEATPQTAPFDEFGAKLVEIMKEVDYDEMWGVKLVTPISTHIPTQIVLQKFLNANDGDLAKAVDQFKGALKFRKEKKPLELVKKIFSAKKFADLGAVTVYPVNGSAVPEVFTWNLYGNVKGKMEEVFAPLDEYDAMSYL